MANQNHYELLGVSRSATKQEIKESYRALARQHRPDINPAVDHQEWADIVEAYEVLSDEEKRQEYDSGKLGKRDTAAERAAAEQAAKVRAAREARRRNAAQAKAYGDRVRGQGSTSSTSQPQTSPRPPRQAPPRRTPPPRPSQQTSPPRPSPQSPPQPPPPKAPPPQKPTQAPAPPVPIHQAVKRRNWRFPAILIGSIIAISFCTVMLTNGTKTIHASAASTIGQSPVTTPKINTPQQATADTATREEAPPSPAPTALPRTASDQLDVTPTYQSAGVVSINEPRGEPPAYIPFTLSSELHGFLLKVDVKASYTPADVRKLKEGINPAGSVKKDIESSCVELPIEVNGGEYSDYKMTPVASRVQQHGSTATATLYYPAVMPGEYKWGCGDHTEESLLGKVTTENLGVLGDVAVYKIHKALADTVVIVGAADGLAFTENEPILSQICVYTDNAPGKKVKHPAKVKVYHRWLSGESEPYMVATLTFDISSSQVPHSSLYPPPCDENEINMERGIPLSS